MFFIYLFHVVSKIPTGGKDKGEDAWDAKLMEERLKEWNKQRSTDAKLEREAVPGKSNEHYVKLDMKHPSTWNSMMNHFFDRKNANSPFRIIDFYSPSLIAPHQINIDWPSSK